MPRQWRERALDVLIGATLAGGVCAYLVPKGEVASPPSFCAHGNPFPCLGCGSDRHYYTVYPPEAE